MWFYWKCEAGLICQSDAHKVLMWELLLHKICWHTIALCFHSTSSVNQYCKIHHNSEIAVISEISAWPGPVILHTSIDNFKLEWSWIANFVYNVTLLNWMQYIQPAGSTRYWREVYSSITHFCVEYICGVPHEPRLWHDKHFFNSLVSCILQ